MSDSRACWARPLAVLLSVSAAASIVTTYDVFSHAWDEPMHIAAGMQLLSTGVYSYELQHPPLARIAAAVGPYLAGLRSRGRVDGFDEGLALLYRAGPYDRTLFLARLGSLPFFFLTLLVTWLWARRLLGEPAALVAVFLMATLPPLLGNAGLAMTDVALLGTCGAALYALTVWFERPDLLHGALVGLTIGLALASKFSSIPFLAIGLVAIVLCRLWMMRAPAVARDLLRGNGWKGLGLGFLVTLVVLWMAYGFAWDFPRLIVGGIQKVTHHNKWGHQSFLLGEVSARGWWYYYPVVLGVKTPIPLLVLGVAGLGMLLRRARRVLDWRLGVPGLVAAGILGFCMTTSINIGVRHVLIVYLMLAIGGAHAVARLLGTAGAAWRRGLAGAIVIALLGWQAVGTIAAHPDHVAWFNLFAGAHPERILLPADLDMGLDVKRLAAEVERRGIKEIHVYCGRPIAIRRHIPGAKSLPGRRRIPGWVAVSLWMREAKGDAFTWLHDYTPVMRVGRSIDLYFIPETAPPTEAPSLKPSEGR